MRMTTCVSGILMEVRARDAFSVINLSTAHVTGDTERGKGGGHDVPGQRFYIALPQLLVCVRDAFLPPAQKRIRARSWAGGGGTHNRQVSTGAAKEWAANT